MQIEEGSRYVSSVLDGNSIIHSDTNAHPGCVDSYIYVWIGLPECTLTPANWLRDIDLSSSCIWQLKDSQCFLSLTRPPLNYWRGLLAMRMLWIIQKHGPMILCSQKCAPKSLSEGRGSDLNDCLTLYCNCSDWVCVYIWLLYLTKYLHREYLNIRILVIRIVYSGPSL